jgi:hypothetical protein
VDLRLKFTDLALGDDIAIAKEAAKFLKLNFSFTRLIQLV